MCFRPIAIYCQVSGQFSNILASLGVFGTGCKENEVKCIGGTSVVVVCELRGNGAERVKDESWSKCISWLSLQTSRPSLFDQADSILLGIPSRTITSPGVDAHGTRLEIRGSRGLP